MIGALWNGISGINGFEKALNIESNNISNVDTIGYKEDVLSFEDMMYQNGYGKGTSLASVSKAMSQQGGIKLTESNYDVAIEGKGYFIVGTTDTDGTPETYYTRAGDFKVSNNGYLQTRGDMNILGLNSVSVPANTKFDDSYINNMASFSINNYNSLQTINARATDYNSTAVSDDLALSGNDYKTRSAKLIDIEALAADYKAKLSLYSSNSLVEPTNSVSQISNIDLSGSMAQLTNENDFIKVTINKNEIKQQFDTDIETTLKKFSDQISNIEGLSSSVDTVTGALTINSLIPGKEDIIQYAQINDNSLLTNNIQDAILGTGKGLSDSSGLALKTAIERAGGKFFDITSTISLTDQKNLGAVDKMQLSLKNLNLSDSIGQIEIKDGMIYSSDGENKFIIGKIQTADFINAQGLSPQGGSLYQVTDQSGVAQYAGDMNKLVGNSLEESKANLGNSLASLLVYQRAFEANSKSITTSDELLRTAIELKK